MADERRGQRPRHLRRGRRGMGGLAMVLLAAVMLGGCEPGDPVIPGSALPPEEETGGTSGGGSAATLIIGTWEATVILGLTGDDFQTTVTTWTFQDNGACLQVVNTTQFSEGVTYTEVHPCTYRLNQGVVVVLYDEAAEEVEYPFSFPVNNRDVLILSGLGYGRLT